MFTTTFTRERHIEELRSELRGTLDPQEARVIRAELEALQCRPEGLADGEISAS